MSWPIDLNKCDPSSEIGFGRPEKQTLKGGATPISYHRIPIFQLSKNIPGSEGIPTPTGRSFTLAMPNYLFCLGIEEKRGMNDPNGPKTKATLALCMHSKPQATPEEREWVRRYLEIIDICKRHVIGIGASIREDGITMGDMQKGFHSMNIPYVRDPGTGLPVKDRDGCKLEDTAKRPYFNPELKTKRNGEGELDYVSKFRQASAVGDEVIDPRSLVREGEEKKRFEISCTVDLDNIYIGQSNISVRWKVRDAYVSFIEEEPFATKRPPPRALSVLSSQSNTPPPDRESAEIVPTTQGASPLMKEDFGYPPVSPTKSEAGSLVDENYKVDAPKTSLKTSPKTSPGDPEQPYPEKTESRDATTKRQLSSPDWTSYTTLKGSSDDQERENSVSGSLSDESLPPGKQVEVAGLNVPKKQRMKYGKA